MADEVEQDDSKPKVPARKRAPRAKKAASTAAPAADAAADSEAASGWSIPEHASEEVPAGWDAESGARRTVAGGQWVQPPAPGPLSAARPETQKPPKLAAPPTPPVAAPARAATAAPTAPPRPAPPVAAPAPGSWLVPAPTSGLFPPAVTATTAVAPVAPPSPPAAPAGWAADIGAGTALAIDIGVILLMIGSFLTGTSSHSFVGSTLISEFDRGFRFRLLAVFSEASFEQAVIVLVAILLTVSVPAERPSVVRRWALAGAAGLGVYIGVGAMLRAVALMTFLGTSAALAVGTTLSCLAAVPVACGASVWAAVLLTRDDKARKAAAAAR